VSRGAFQANIHRGTAAKACHLIHDDLTVETPCRLG